jgi:RNA polymerase sigma factor (TIGR02999 family)
MEPQPDITRLIVEWQQGNREAESALFEQLYQRLHTIAAHLTRAEATENSMGATALIHEAYMRFCGTTQLKIVNRSHFLALAARVMRRILVDRARARKAAKRNASDESTGPSAWFRDEAEVDEVIAVDRALDVLRTRSPRQCRLVELRYFGGYTIEESAVALDISPRHARREWDVARTRLREAIDGAAATQ